MALATKCPHCNTIFRVAHDQLKLRGGIVRCGACNEVFDGNAALVEPAARPAAAPAVILAPAAPAPFDAPLTPFDEKMAALDTRAATALQPDSAEPIYMLDLDEGNAGLPVADEHVPNQYIQNGHVPDGYIPPSAGHAWSGPDLPGGAPTLDALTARDDDRHPALAAADEPLHLDLDDIEPAPAPLAEPEPVPAAPFPPSASSAFDALLDPHAVSDDELAETLAAELAGQPPAEDDSLADSLANSPTDLLAEYQPHDPSDELPDDIGSDGRREPTFGEPPAEHLVAAALADGHHPRYNELEEQDEEALVQLSAAAVEQARPTRPALSDPAQQDGEAPPPADTGLTEIAGEDGIEEPGFVRRDRLRSQWRKASAIVMGLGSALLLSLLLGQVVATFRNPLAARVPSLKPALQTACVVLGCRVELPSQIDDVTIEQGELQTLNETTFSFTTLLRNQSGTAQSWPHIELILDDASDKAVLRRVFAPRDYLGPAADIARGFAPHTEQSVKLYFELAQLKASGYHIAVFYP